jgi:glycosyltransferase involved in cell wall biosynthesis
VKLAVLSMMLSGYMAACLEAYRRQTGAKLLVLAWPCEKNAPFAASSFSGLGEILDRSKFGQEQIEECVRKFGPEAVLVSGWGDAGYNRICRRLRASGIPIIAGCDTAWRGSLRQHIAAFAAPWHVHRFIEVLWVTGERQRQLARALGFRGARCWDGFYACNWEQFARKTPDAPSGRARSFLFVGRYVEEKGIRDLAAAYRNYRTEVKDGWPLVCAGKGGLAPLLAEAGADDRGFVQPECLSDLMQQAGALVLPSLFEPWGVVLQEAAASGLPLIVSEACGAGVHLVRDGYNGYVTEPGQVRSLSSALVRMHRLSDVERQEFGRRSFELSKQYKPERWARTLQEGLAMLSYESDLAHDPIATGSGTKQDLETAIIKSFPLPPSSGVADETEEGSNGPGEWRKLAGVWQAGWCWRLPG